MRVLEVQENLEWDSSSLERPPQEQEDSPPQLEDTEKALLRQMCNVSVPIHVIGGPKQGDTGWMAIV